MYYDIENRLGLQFSLTYHLTPLKGGKTERRVGHVFGK
jgi:hypothetical protein